MQHTHLQNIKYTEKIHLHTFAYKWTHTYTCAYINKAKREEFNKFVSIICRLKKYYKVFPKDLIW